MLLAMIVVGLAGLLWLARDLTFLHDDWSFILGRTLSVDDILRPHNEHLSATLVMLYRVLVGTFGIGSYWPFVSVTLALHIVIVVLVYVAARREAPASWAIGVAAVTLFLGAGGYDIRGRSNLGPTARWLRGWPRRSWRRAGPPPRLAC